MTIQTGQLMAIADLVARHNQTRELLNNLGSQHSKPETFGPQHCPSLLGEADFYEWVGIEDFANGTTNPPPPGTDPEQVTGMLLDWVTSPSMTLTNGGAGYTIQRPCILVAYANITVGGWATVAPGAGFATPENRWAGFTLWNEIDGITADNGPQGSAWVRPFQVGITGGADQVPSKCYAKNVGLLRVWYFDESSPTLTLDELSVKYVLLNVPTAPTGDCRLRGGSIGFFAIHTPPA